MPRALAVLLRATIVASLLLLPLARAARADEVAPELESADLRYKARAELRRLFAAMPAADRRRLVGAYVAFDDDAFNPAAQVACDDDGDYVIVVSDAMLRLASHLAHLASTRSRTRSCAAGDESGDDSAWQPVDDYATFLARAALPGRRLLPPPAGALAADEDGATYESCLGEIMSFVVARELVRLRAGDLVCPHPTATAESQDDVWSAAERRQAAVVARTVYAPDPSTRAEAEATHRMLEVGRGTAGASVLLRFFDRLARADEARVVSSYARLHPPLLVRPSVTDARRSTTSAAELKDTR